MSFLIHLFLGFFVAFLGSVPPGMLNMTVLRMSIEKGLKSGMSFATGAATVFFVYAFIALTFSQFLSDNPEVLAILKKIAIVIFFGLAIYFFVQARKKIKMEGKASGGKAFFSGMLMATMNMLVIPSYFVYSTIFGANGWMILKQPFITVFVLGVFLGVFAIFWAYARFAQLIVRRAQFIARNINYILSVLFVMLGVVQLVQVFGGLV